MGYEQARTKVDSGRRGRIVTLQGDKPGQWFTDLWQSIREMLNDFSTVGENKEIAGGYNSSPSLTRVAPNLRLDYVCALRREFRKQYVSGTGDVCTDVTPFRHGIMSAHGARMFDNLMESVVRFSEQQAKGVVA